MNHDNTLQLIFRNNSNCDSARIGNASVAYADDPLAPICINLHQWGLVWGLIFRGRVALEEHELGFLTESAQGLSLK